MDQKTGIGWLYDEFSRGYGAEIRVFCPDFRPNSTYKPTYASSLPEAAVSLATSRSVPMSLSVRWRSNESTRPDGPSRLGQETGRIHVSSNRPSLRVGPDH